MDSEPQLLLVFYEYMEQAGLISILRMKKISELDVFYLVINHIDVDLDIKYLLRDILYLFIN